jgi:DNA repair protein RecO (recombination protein O)
MKSTDTGIFLQRSVYSDSSLIVTFLCAEHGLRKFIFRGGRKKAHGIFALSVAELNFYGRADSELLNLTSVEPCRVQHFPAHPVKSTVAFFMAEVIRKCIERDQIDRTLYDFAIDWIEALETSNDLALFPLSFLVGATEILGIRPLLDRADYTVFNLDSGEFQDTESSLERCASGPAVVLIACLLEGGLIDASLRSHREQAMEIMLQYYAIHVPRFQKLDTYEVVKEVLRA